MADVHMQVYEVVLGYVTEMWGDGFYLKWLHEYRLRDSVFPPLRLLWVPL